MTRFQAFALALASVLVTASSGRAGAEQVKGDEQTVRDAGLSVDGPALVEFFAKRTPGDETRQNIQTLVRDLGHKNYHVREKACRELVVLGPPALAPLKRALKSRDLEVCRRAARCVQEIEKSVQPHLTAAAVRLLAHRKPPRATPVLLNYLPFAAGEEIAEEIVAALVVLNGKGGKPDDALLAALTDKNAVCRGAAGEVLARVGGAAGRLRVRPLLKDADVQVRLRVALALVDLKEKEAVGTLVELLPALSPEQAARVEPVLVACAGDRAPSADGGNSDEGRRRHAAAWAAWWQSNGGKLDLARIDTGRRLLGLTLIVQFNSRTRRIGGGPGGRGIAQLGRVFEIGPDGKKRWELDGLNYPVEAQVVGPNRVLIVEYRSRQVTERTFKGDIVWQKQFPAYVAGARRLANGNTLVNTRSQIVEVDRTGREVFTYRAFGSPLVAAGRTRNGQTIVVDCAGLCLTLDRTGREIKRFEVVRPLSTIGLHVDILPNGNVLIPHSTRNNVVEYDANGRKVWEVTVARPTSAVRLPNGNTLVTSRYSRLIQELDKNGKKVWEHQLESAIVLHANRR